MNGATKPSFFLEGGIEILKPRGWGMQFATNWASKKKSCTLIIIVVIKLAHFCKSFTIQS